jgi:hypothetical protein
MAVRHVEGLPSLRALLQVTYGLTSSLSPSAFIVLVLKVMIEHVTDIFAENCCPRELLVTSKTFNSAALDQLPAVFPSAQYGIYSLPPAAPTLDSAASSASTTSVATIAPDTKILAVRFPRAPVLSITVSPRYNYIFPP